MGNVSKEDKSAINEAVKLKKSLMMEIKSLKDIEQKTKNDYKTLISKCKEYIKQIEFLQENGYAISIQKKYAYPEYWMSELEKFLRKSMFTPNKKKTKKHSADNTYYIMICWSVTPDYFICDGLIEVLKNYFEKLKLKHNIEFIDIMKDDFPGRTEYTCTYKAKITPEVYNTIISSAEYILDISNSSTYDKCNIGIFGKIIE